MAVPPTTAATPGAKALSQLGQADVTRPSRQANAVTVPAQPAANEAAPEAPERLRKRPRREEEEEGDSGQASAKDDKRNEIVCSWRVPKEPITSERDLMWTEFRRTEKIPVKKLRGRVLSENVYASRALPEYDTALIDGYAVNKVQDATETSRKEYRVIGGRMLHGENDAILVKEGQPVPGNTTDIIPLSECGRVVYSSVHRHSIFVTWANVAKRQAIAKKESQVQERAVVLNKLTRVENSETIAMLKQLDIEHVHAFKKLCVATLVVQSPGSTESKTVKAKLRFVAFECDRNNFDRQHFGTFQSDRPESIKRTVKNVLARYSVLLIVADGPESAASVNSVLEKGCHGKERFKGVPDTVARIKTTKDESEQWHEALRDRPDSALDQISAFELLLDVSDKARTKYAFTIFGSQLELTAKCRVVIFPNLRVMSGQQTNDCFTDAQTIKFKKAIELKSPVIPFRFVGPNREPEVVGDLELMLTGADGYLFLSQRQLWASNPRMSLPGGIVLARPNVPFSQRVPYTGKLCLFK